MRKKIIGLVAVTIVLLLLFMPDVVSAETKTGKYTIESYNIEANESYNFFNEEDKFPMAVILLCMAFVLIAGGLWVKYGKDDTIVEIVEFHPPKGYNSAEVGFLYEGAAETKSIISLLVYLANKGYLKISGIESNGVFKKTKSFRLTKLKEYDGNNEIEQIFFHGLFKDSKVRAIHMDKAKKIMKEAKKQGKKISLSDALEMATDNYSYKSSVTANDLYNNFYTTLNRIKMICNCTENKNKIFEKAARGKGKWLKLMLIIIFLFITEIPLLAYYGEGIVIVSIFALAFTGIGFNVLLDSVIDSFINITKRVKITSTGIMGITMGGLFAGIPWIMFVLPALKGKLLYIIMYIVGLLSIAALKIFIKIMPKRTPYGKEMLGKIKGFRRFLETAEKSQLEALVNENPKYFYDILPYTYALGVSDVWMRQFETIALQAPDWYETDYSFNIHEFSHFMNHTMKMAENVMSSSPSSDSQDSFSGDSSGGGISGGGSGGGGGGSW